MKKCFTILLLLTIICCNKKQLEPITKDIKQPIKCSNWVGRWVYDINDITINDSVILEIDFYSFKDNKSIVQYKSNLLIYDSLLWHYCPIPNKLNEDFIILDSINNIKLKYYH